MKMSKLLTLIAVVMVLVLAFTACGPKEQPDEPHKCESACETCGKCTDAACTEDACKGKCEGHNTPDPTPNETTPAISVNPPALEINAGDEIDLMFGVTVTDEGDPDVRVIISDDDGFDAEVVGTYTITYTAQNKYGKTATGTRTVTVLEALSALSLEVRANRLGETKWQGNILSFKNSEFVTINANYVSEVAISGVFYNASSSELTVNIAGQYAVTAVIDANGFVLEGRDGANGRLVNQANPDRTSSTATTIQVGDETVSVVSAAAKNLVVPAGGYAIVVQNGYCGTTVDSDGRGFMNYNVIYQYGNVVRLVWADSAEVITPYVDQAPVITGHGNKVLANLADGEFVLADAIAAGLTVTDDNGTFDPSDDVKLTVSVTNDGGFNINAVGSYTVTVAATDGEHTTTVTRVVDVVDNLVSVKVNDNAYSLLPDKIAIDEDLSKLGSYLFVVYTPSYTGTLNWTEGWGVAFILNEYGQIVRIYDGANGKYYDADNLGGVVDATKCTAQGYLTEAFTSRQAGEYMIVAPNGAAGQLTRKFFLDNRTIGAQMTVPGLSFVHACESVCDQCGKCLDADCTEAACAEKCEGHDHSCSNKCDVCGKCLNADCTEEICLAKCDCVVVTVNGKSITIKAGTIAIDEAAPALGNYNFVIYTYSFKENNAELSWNNGWSQAFILNEYGQVVRVYDGVSGGKYFDAANRAGIVDATITTAANILKDAYASLKAGETLILGANGGMNGNAGRSFLGGVRVIGALAEIPGITFTALPEHACESKCDICGKCTDATCIFPDCLAQCACHRCESICPDCDGCLDATCTEAACETKCSCHTCTDRCDICGGCKVADCTDTVCEVKCVCSYTGNDKYFAIGGNAFHAAEGKWLYNSLVNNSTDPKAQNYRLIIFDKNYTGTFTTNAYGVAVVVDANGCLVKGYDWTGYYTAEGKVAATTFDANTYATVAFAELKDGETLIIFANDGANGPDSARTFGQLICTVENMGKKVHITGFEFGGAVTPDPEPEHTCESVCEHCGKCADAACTETVCADKCPGHEKSMFVTIGSKKFEAVDGKWAINETITTATAASKAVWVFTKDYTGDFSTNGFGVAVVLDQFGRVLRIYDGANAGYTDAESGVGNKNYGVTTDNYATLAWESLQAGETLVVLPNGGSDGNAARQVGLDCRWLIGQKMNLTGVEFASTTMTITIGSKTYTAELGKWAVNETITTATAANKAIWVFTKDYTGDFSTNGFGVAVVLDQFGRVVRIYDGANAGYTDAESGVNNKDHGVTSSNFATLAWESLQAGETLVVLPNGGSDGNAARQVGLDCRWLIGQKMSITGVEFASTTMTIQIGSKNYTAELGKWAINETITTDTAVNNAIWVFTKDYTGDFSTNGFGVALVLDAQGKVLRVYDGANAGYTDAESGVNNKDHGVTSSNFATLAWESLQAGETLVVLPNGGSDGNAARQVGLDCRWLIGQKMTITNVDFAD